MKDLSRSVKRGRPPARPSGRGALACLITADEVAERLGVSLRTVRRLIEAGELPVHRIGRAVRISEDDLERFVATRRIG